MKILAHKIDRYVLILTMKKQHTMWNHFHNVLSRYFKSIIPKKHFKINDDGNTDASNLNSHNSTEK